VQRLGSINALPSRDREGAVSQEAAVRVATKVTRGWPISAYNRRHVDMIKFQDALANGYRQAHRLVMFFARQIAFARLVS